MPHHFTHLPNSNRLAQHARKQDFCDNWHKWPWFQSHALLRKDVPDSLACRIQLMLLQRSGAELSSTWKRIACNHTRTHQVVHRLTWAPLWGLDQSPHAWALPHTMQPVMRLMPASLVDGIPLPIWCHNTLPTGWTKQCRRCPVSPPRHWFKWNQNYCCCNTGQTDKYTLPPKRHTTRQDKKTAKSQTRSRPKYKGLPLACCMHNISQTNSFWFIDNMLFVLNTKHVHKLLFCMRCDLENVYIPACTDCQDSTQRPWNSFHLLWWHQESRENQAEQTHRPWSSEPLCFLRPLNKRITQSRQGCSKVQTCRSLSTTQHATITSAIYAYKDQPQPQTSTEVLLLNRP